MEEIGEEDRGVCYVQSEYFEISLLVSILIEVGGGGRENNITTITFCIFILFNLFCDL